MKYNLFLTFLVFIAFTKNAFSATESYPVNTIPDQLLENADAVIRYDYLKFEVINEQKGVRTIKKVITILNENAIYHADIVIPYNKNNKIVYLNAKIYDANGDLIKKLDSDDIIDESNIPFGTLFTDSRIKKFELYAATFPFTIEINYEIKTKDMLFYPSIYFQPDNETSVELAEFELHLPQGMYFRYKEFNLKGQHDSISEKNKNIYKWKESNLQAFKEEYYSIPYQKNSPHIITTANSLNFSKYKGDITSWENFGKWILKINTIDRELPVDLINEINAYVGDINDETEKIRKVYDFVQASTRYVNVSYNIGGYQPKTPESVYRLGYGDCKALTMYTKELLNAVGINSYYTLVNAGRNKSDIDVTFPSFQFNHAILCIPRNNDTIWLECTSQTLPYGFLGSFTDNRHALLITQEGGKLVKTTSYDEIDNKRYMTAEIDLLKNANAKSKLALHYKGMEYDKVDFDYLIESGRKVQRDWLYENLGLASFTITNWEFVDNRQRIPEAKISMNLDVTSFLTAGENSLYFRPNMSLKWLFIPSKQLDRQNDLYFSKDYFDSISIVYNIAYGVELEFLPENKSISSEFGEYQYVFEKLDKKTIRFIRSLKINKGTYPAEKFNNYVDFVRQVVKSDKELVILRKT